MPALASTSAQATKWIASLAEAEPNLVRKYEQNSYGDYLPSPAFTLLGGGRRAARTRADLCAKFAYMASDPIMAAGLKILNVATLGGDPQNGKSVFLEKAAAVKDAKAGKMVQEVSDDLSDLLNGLASKWLFEGMSQGDGYVRPYLQKKTGLIDARIDELTSACTIIPYERGSQTVGFVSVVGERGAQRLSRHQIVRLKMPRRVYIPQISAIQKVQQAVLTQDEWERLDPAPCDVGGSLLYECEPAFDDLIASLVGIAGQRLLDSIDERMIGVQLRGADAGQQKRLIDSLIGMLNNSRKLAMDAVKSGQPPLGRHRYVMPMWDDKQLINLDIGNPGATGRTGAYQVDDVMFNARRVTGPLGVDLSLLGFADQMSGALGEGGIFRASAMVAEHAQAGRTALRQAMLDLIDLHVFYKYGVAYPASERPWSVNFYGGISAYENERQATRERAMGAAGAMAQTMESLNQLGFNEKQKIEFYSKEMLIDEERAKLYASAKPPAQGGFGGGDNPNAGAGDFGQ